LTWSSTLELLRRLSPGDVVIVIAGLGIGGIGNGIAIGASVSMSARCVSIASWVSEGSASEGTGNWRCGATAGDPDPDPDPELCESPKSSIDWQWKSKENFRAGDDVSWNSLTLAARGSTISGGDHDIYI
jgi:hypothetical protein